MKLEGVEVRVERHEDADFKPAIIIKVYSQKRPGLAATMILALVPGNTTQQIAKGLEKAGRDAVEYLFANYGDQLEVKETQQKLIIAFRDELRAISDASKDVKQKLAIIQTLPLTDKEQEYVSLLLFVEKQAGYFTLGDINWINKKVRRRQ